MIGNRRNVLPVGQFAGQIGGVISFHTVDNATGSRALPNETGNGRYLLSLIESSTHVEGEVGTVESGEAVSEYLGE